MSDNLGRFEHHPDPVIDFEVEVEAIEGMIADHRAGLVERQPIIKRIDRAMGFRVGGTIEGINAKAHLRKLEAQFLVLP